MATPSNVLQDIERDLDRRGVTPEVRKAIHSAKIAVIDDRIDHLKSFIEGLKGEGFTHLVEVQQVESIDALVREEFDLVILDLDGVASDVVDGDGLGVLRELKRIRPALPILVVSGSQPNAEQSRTLRMADAVRNKPIRPGDLAREVEELVKYRKDELWTSLAVLQALRQLTPDLQEKLGAYDRARLRFTEWRLVKGVQKQDPSQRARLIQIAGIVGRLGSVGAKVYGLAHGVPA